MYFGTIQRSVQVFLTELFFMIFDNLYKTYIMYVCDALLLFTCYSFTCGPLPQVVPQVMFALSSQIELLYGCWKEEEKNGERKEGR